MSLEQAIKENTEVLKTLVSKIDKLNILNLPIETPSEEPSNQLRLPLEERESITEEVEEVEEVAEVVFDDLKEAATKIVDIKSLGGAALKSVLKEQFGVAKISALTPQQYPDALNAFNEKIAGA